MLKTVIVCLRAELFQHWEAIIGGTTLENDDASTRKLTDPDFFGDCIPEAKKEEKTPAPFFWPPFGSSRVTRSLPGKLSVCPSY